MDATQQKGSPKQLRGGSLGTKLSEAEYAQCEKSAARRGQTLRELRLHSMRPSDAQTARTWCRRQEGVALSLPHRRAIIQRYNRRKDMTIEERVAFLIQSTESHDRQIGDLTDKFANMSAEWNARFNKLLSLVEIDAENIRSLARTAEAH